MVFRQYIPLSLYSPWSAIVSVRGAEISQPDIVGHKTAPVAPPAVAEVTGTNVVGMVGFRFTFLGESYLVVIATDLGKGIRS